MARRPPPHRPLTVQPRVAGRLGSVVPALLLTMVSLGAQAESSRPQTRSPLPSARIDWQLAALNPALTEPAQLNDRSASTDSTDSATNDHSAPDAATATPATPSSRWGKARTALQDFGVSLRTLWARVQGRTLQAAAQPVEPASTLDDSPGTISRLFPHDLQMFADYAVEGGFRATAGVVRPESGNWWLTNDRAGALNSSYQRLNAAGVLSSASVQPVDSSTNASRAYLGAGYSSRLVYKGTPSLWRFNADLGLMSLNNGLAAHISPSPNSDRGVDDLVHDLRLRPNIKVSVGYSF